MAFDEVRLPTEMEYGVSGGTGFSTAVFKSKSGYEQRVAVWSQGLGQWRVGYGLQDETERRALLSFFHAREGRLRGFRFRDWADYQVVGVAAAPAEPYASGVLRNTVTGLYEGDGSTTTFQAARAFTSGAQTHYKDVLKPEAGSEQAYVNGSPVGSTMDDETGIFTISPAPGAGLSTTWDGDFDKPVRLDDDLIEIEVEYFERYSWRGVRIIELRDIA
jgi:uncharacterized protein (TIGR02217 family)